MATKKKAPLTEPDPALDLARKHGLPVEVVQDILDHGSK